MAGAESRGRGSHAFRAPVRLEDGGVRRLQAYMRGHHTRNALIDTVRQEYEELVLAIEGSDTKVVFASRTICMPQFEKHHKVTRTIVVKQEATKPKLDTLPDTAAELLAELKWTKDALRSRLNFLEEQRIRRGR